MKFLPLGVQTFRDFIEHDYLYVDKTKQIYDLFAKGGKYFFLSRPRRFGKSVLVSTLKEIFSGNKELFKGLWIHDKIEWTKHPVIHIDFSKVTSKTPDILEQSLNSLIEDVASDNKIKLDPKLFLKDKFGRLIKKISQAKQQKVVILIDEYDKPIIQFMEMGKIKEAKEIRDALKNFFGIIKGSDEFLRFVFITGVSKFSRVSIFSDLNNLTDITLHDHFSTLVGYTQKELEQYFSPFIEKMAKKRGQSQKDLANTIRRWYNGYSWDGENFVYNPFSIVNLFDNGKFKNFWFTSGTPGFLITTIKKQKSDIVSFENLPVKSYTFEAYDIENLEIPALLFQTGYLTIKKITMKGESETYHLSYPNQEVRDSFLTYLFDLFVKKKMTISTGLIETFRETIENDDIDSFFKEIKSLFASIPHQIIIGEKEAYYHSLIYLVSSLAGASVRCEESTNKGRIDAVLETDRKIYIMEFKMGSAQEAMNQIKAKKYYEKYLNSGKEILLLGIGFDPEERNLGSYLSEKL